MSLSAYNPGDRYRRKAHERKAALIKVAITTIFLFGLGFLAGREYSRSLSSAVEKENKTLTAESEKLRNDNVDLRAKLQTKTVQFDQLKTQYEQNLPQGEMAEITKHINQLISDGMPADRIKQMVSGANAPRECTEPKTQRIIVSTPTYKGANNDINLDDGAVIISASGVSAENAKGEKEAWFNTAQPIIVTFKLKNPQASEGMFKDKVITHEGTLPFNKAIMLGEEEYRIRFEAGAKSFLKVTHDKCAI